ncbi:hypothetical protein BH09BAC5_BH09BAC5_14740 [soil metagenome]
MLSIAKWIGGNYVDTCGVINSGISENANETQLSLYPNPTSDQLFVNYNGLKADDLRFTVFNMLGEIVKTVDIGKTDGVSSYAFDLINIASGVYFVQVQYNGQVASKKFVKQ